MTVRIRKVIWHEFKLLENGRTRISPRHFYTVSVDGKRVDSFLKKKFANQLAKQLRKLR